MHEVLYLITSCTLQVRYRVPTQCKAHCTAAAMGFLCDGPANSDYSAATGQPNIGWLWAHTHDWS